MRAWGVWAAPRCGAAASWPDGWLLKEERASRPVILHAVSSTIRARQPSFPRRRESSIIPVPVPCFPPRRGGAPTTPVEKRRGTARSSSACRAHTTLLRTAGVLFCPHAKAARLHSRQQTERNAVCRRYLQPRPTPGAAPLRGGRGFFPSLRRISAGLCEDHDTMASAIAREKTIKKWNRAWKLRLIEEMNPDWRDLAEDLP